MTPAARAREIVQKWRTDVGAAAVPERDYYDQVDYDALAVDIAAALAAAERAGIERAAKVAGEDMWNRYADDVTWGAAQQAACTEVAAAIRALATPPGAPEGGA